MEDRCLYCGEIIPEGRQICPGCEDALYREIDEKKLTSVFPDYPCKRCKTTHKANCMCGYWISWFSNHWKALQSILKR